MPFEIYTLAQARQVVRDYITGKLPANALAPPNARARVIGDANAAMAALNLLFLRWQATNLLPDQAEWDWLLRWANIYLGGPKAATFANGTATATGIAGMVLPSGSEISGSGIAAQTTQDVTIGSGPTTVPITSLTPGVVGNLAAGQSLALTTAISGIDANLTMVAMAGGVDAETPEQLRARVLFRIQQPPMGGDADDYVDWALQVPGVTRAWCSPLEMGIGTVTVRFMMDDLRATTDPTTSGFPTTDDIATVIAALNAKRPVAVKDFYVEAPIPEPINFTVTNLSADSSATRAALEASVAAMINGKAKPAYALNGVGQSAQTIYAAWVNDAILAAEGVDHFDLTMSDHVMPDNGHLAVQGVTTYA
jgi:uncharacterized phage protein gp47/JayE